MNKQQLAAKIWKSANKMRSKIEATEYKDYILGFIFYKFLSDKEIKELKELGMKNEEIKCVTEENTMIKNTMQRQIGYFISYENLFTTWIDMGKRFNVSNVRDALSAFNRLIGSSHRKVFDGIFKTLDTGLSKLGDTPGTQTKAIRDLVYLIKDIPMDNKQDYDVLGFIYEYLISNFAANAGKKAGEFYTPHEVSLLMSEIIAEHLKDRNQIEIYDPTSGSGSLLINIGRTSAKYIKNPNAIKYYAQELKENTYNLTRMNLIMRGIIPDNIIIRNGDTLKDDWPYFDENHTYTPLFVDAVVSNPPYSQNWDPDNRDVDPRFSEYGLAPKSKADYAFLLHDLYHLKSDGIMTIVLPHGVLFRGNEEGKIRKNLIEKHNIYAIIGLPSNIFFGTGIPTIIMVLKKGRVESDIQIIDASKGFIKDGKKNKLRACDIKKIVDAIIARKNIDKFSAVVTLDEIRKNDYNLNIPRYVDSSDEQEKFDMYAIMNGGIPKDEINSLNNYFEVFPNLKDDLFKPINSEYYEIKVDDIDKFIQNHKDIDKFKKQYNNKFKNFEKYLYDELINNYNFVNINNEEQKICRDIFDRFENVKLINKYEAYQVLDDEWNKISNDLESIQKEGIETCRKIDPVYETKKKNGGENEVQTGIEGHIIPFELVQEYYLPDLKTKIKNEKNKLNEIENDLQETIDELSEEDIISFKEYLNDDNKFISKKVSKYVKEHKNDEIKDDLLGKIMFYVNDLFEEQKKIKKQVKNDNIELINKTRDIINNLSNDEIFELLNNKWVKPIVYGIKNLDNVLIYDFIKKIKRLSEKYLTTLNDVEKEIHETEAELSDMLNALTGTEYDMKGIKDFESLIKGDLYGKD